MATIGTFHEDQHRLHGSIQTVGLKESRDHSVEKRGETAPDYRRSSGRSRSAQAGPAPARAVASS